MLIMSSGYCSFNLYLSYFQVGFVVSCALLFVAYFVTGLTTLSVSAISTNGNVKGGGVYCILYIASSNATHYFSLSCARHLDKVLKVFTTGLADTEECYVMLETQDSGVAKTMNRLRKFARKLPYL